METVDLLKKVRRIEIKSRQLSRHIFAGEYHSAFKGKGMTFSEVREYHYGDDIRSIDWNVTARFNHPYIKVFEEERESTVMLLVDASGSNEFGTTTQLKKNMVAEIAAVLAFSAIENNDKVGLVLFTNKIEKFIPPKKGRHHTLLIIRELLNFQPGSRATNIAEALRFLTNAIKKRSISFLISDFVDSGYDDALRIAARKHDMVGIKVFDPREGVLPDIGLAYVKDAETGATLLVDTSPVETRSRYRQQWKKRDAELTELVMRSGIDLISVATDQDYVKPLVGLFKRRASAA